MSRKVKDNSENPHNRNTCFSVFRGIFVITIRSFFQNFSNGENTDYTCIKVPWIWDSILFSLHGICKRDSYPEGSLKRLRSQGNKKLLNYSNLVDHCSTFTPLCFSTKNNITMQIITLIAVRKTELEFKIRLLSNLTAAKIEAQLLRPTECLSRPFNTVHLVYEKAFCVLS